MGHERNIIGSEFSDMEVIDTKKSIKHDYKDKSRKREKLKEKDEEGNITQAYSPAGDRYGIRYEELLCFIISAM